MQTTEDDNSRLKKIGIWLLEKIVEQKVLPSVLLWLAVSWAAFRVWMHQKAVPLWVFLAFLTVLVPASYGVVAFVRTWRMRLNFYVTADPIRSLACDAGFRNQAAIQVQLAATFTNKSDYDLLLLYAYIKGTKPLMHFETPIHVEPHTVQQEVLHFFCTKSKETITASYSPTIVFVDAGGKKKSQRVTVDGVPSPTQPKPAGNLQPQVATTNSSNSPTSST